MAHPSVQYTLTTAAVVAAILVLWGAGKRILAFVRRVTHFLDDWGGEAERPGVPARPGAMARLAAVENRLDTVEQDTRQLRRNGGSHLADAIARVENALIASPVAPAAVATVVATGVPEPAVLAPDPGVIT